ncbi:MAG: GFA family protein [Myxococcaceae bacterium]|nr:GFA family protein [Myxococcaceae bacterium]
MPIQGSCHCGKIAYTLDAEPTEAMECNCSICRRKGYLLTFSTPDKFTLKTLRDDITVYTFNKHVIRHQFCKVCGCAPFGEGTGPDGKEMVAVNLRCAEGVDLSKLKIHHFDGASM